MSEREWPAAALLVLVVALAHGLGIAGGFVYDDVPDLVQHPVVNGDAPLSDLLDYNFMGAPIDDGVNTIRPLTTALYAVGWRLWGATPAAFHALVLAWYLAAVLVLWRLYRRFLGLWSATLAAAVFAAMAIHVEAVASIVGGAETLSLLLALLAIHRALDERAASASALFCAALLAKESAIATPVIVAWYWVCREGWSSLRPQRRGKVPLILLACAAVYLAARAAVLPLDVGGRVLAPDNPLLVAGAGERLWMPLVLIGDYLIAAVRPTALAMDYTYNALPIHADLSDPAGWLGLAALLAAVVVCVRRRGDDGLRFAAGATVLAYAVFSNTVFLNVTLFAERLFLAPSAWLALALACAGQRAIERGAAREVDGDARDTRTRRLLIALVAVVLVVQIPLSAWRTRQWRSTEALVAAQIDVRPSSVKVQLYWAQAVAADGHLEDALWHLAIAADGRRAFPGPWRAPAAPPGLTPADRLVALPALLAPDVDALVFYSGLRAAAADALGSAGAAAVDAAVRRWRRAHRAPPSGAAP